MKFKVCNTVVITDKGRQYLGNNDWFFKFAPELYPLFGYGYLAENGARGKVVKIHKHEPFDDILCAVELTNKKIILMDERGLKLEEQPITKTCQNCIYKSHAATSMECINCFNCKNFTREQPIQKTHNLIIVTHENDTRRYLFEVPKGVEIKQGEMLFADTKRDKQVVKAHTDSIIASEETLIIVGNLIGAKLNGMKMITGRAKQSTEWKEDVFK